MSIVANLKNGSIKLHKANGYYEHAMIDNKIYYYEDKINAWEKKKYAEAVARFEADPDPNKVHILHDFKINLLGLAITAGEFTVAEDIIDLPGFDRNLDTNLVVLADYPEIDVLNLFIKKGLTIEANKVVENTRSIVVVDTLCKMGFRFEDLYIKHPGTYVVLYKYGYRISPETVFYANETVLEELFMLDPSLIKEVIGGNDPLQACCLELAKEIEHRSSNEYESRMIIKTGVYDQEDDRYKFLVSRLSPLLRAGGRLDNIQPSGLHAFDLSPKLGEIIISTGLFRPPVFDFSD